MAAYSASKWGLEGMVAALQMELEGTGVRASACGPGPTWSEMGGDWDRRGRRDVIDRLVRFGLARHPDFLRRGASQPRSPRWSAPRAACTSA